MTHNLPWVERLTAFSFLWTQDRVAETLQRNPRAHIVFDNKSEPQAFILWLQQSEDEVEILALATNPERQGRGLMKSLLQRWVKDLGKTSVCRVFLEVHAKNQPALQLYSSLGFQIQAKRARYYQDGEAALVLKLIIGS